ncbi:MAG TPA: NAD(P)/FAD-dependent oxidoreductase [Polyangiaceae bacterium]
MSDPDSVDVAVIGAGVVGLAVARALALAGREVIVIETEAMSGVHTSSRNSEVIHAGIYYPTGSLKARYCVSGKQSLYAYCEASGVPHARIGKIIVATRDEEIPALERLLRQAGENGVHDLEWLDRATLRELEPNVVAVRGLLSPSTGIIDSHELMAAFKRDAVEHGAHVIFSTPVLGGRVQGGGIELELGGPEPTTIRCRAVVNSAGLFAPAVSRSIAGLRPESIPRAYFAKGHYFVLGGRSPFRRLVYPIPVPGGLGVHVTLDLAGSTRFGPDVSWIDGVDYSFDASRGASFYSAVRSYYPALVDGSLEPGYCGIRPKIAGPGSPNADFVLHSVEEHGVPGYVALYGIESPGLTASLAIADEVARLLG